MSSPILHEGSISCTLYRGTKPAVTTESLDFSIAWSSIEVQDPEELLTEVEGKRAELHCPEIPSSTDQSSMVNVWHSTVDYDADDQDPMIGVENLKYSGKMGFLRPLIALQLEQSQTPITCSVYDIKAPKVIYRTRYKVLSSAFKSPNQYTSHSLQAFHHQQEEDKEEDSQETTEFIPQSTFSFSTITLSVVGAVIVLIVIVVAYSSYKYALIT